MHRPLRKVEKSSNLMLSTTGFNILFFVIFAIFQYHYYYRQGGSNYSLTYIIHYRPKKSQGIPRMGNHCGRIFRVDINILFPHLLHWAWLCFSWLRNYRYIASCQWKEHRPWEFLFLLQNHQVREDLPLQLLQALCGKIRPPLHLCEQLHRASEP